MRTNPRAQWRQLVQRHNKRGARQNGLRHSHARRPLAAQRQRGVGEKSAAAEAFNAPELWFEATGRTKIRYRVQEPGAGYVHPVSVDEVRERLSELPPALTRGVEVIQFSRMTRKRAIFPCYGMQWGSNIYLYPIEESLEETYVRPPMPQQLIEARMYGGVWSQDGNYWKLTWTKDAIRDFYLNNVLIHEIGHANDFRNTSFIERERFANWFAVEYGYRTSRGRKN